MTGDSGGLGQTIVDVLLSKTPYGVIGISRSPRQVEGHAPYIPINYDLEQVDGIKELYLKQIKPIGPIHGVVNNSAFAYDDLATNFEPSALDKMFKINVIAPMMLTKYAIRDMLLHDTKGSIVHVSSVSAHTGYKGLSAYAATKGALESYSKGISREWGNRGIRSNCVVPGFMETDMSSSLSPEQKNKIYNRTALKQPTDPRSVAEAVEFLLSERSSSITGQLLHIDSGTI